MTDQFPDGKLRPDDEGSTMIKISHEKGRVVIEFEEPCAWIGLPAEQALGLAELIVAHARACGCTRPLEFRVG